MTGFKGRGENRRKRRNGEDRVDNVIPFPSRPQAEPTVEPEFREAIDTILNLIADPSTYDSPLLTDLSMTTAVALLRSAAGEPDALGPPDSPADIVPEPSPEELAASATTMVATLSDLALERPMRWPDAPDAQRAADVVYALSLAGGPLAQPAHTAMADHNFQPSPHMVHFDTAEVTAAYLITFQNGDAFDLLFELRYPDLAEDEPHPAYMVHLAILDRPIVTAVHGSEDIGDVLQTLATLERSIDRAGPQVHHEPVELVDALATLDEGLTKFNTTMGAAADADGAEVGNQRLFMGGLLRRAPVDPRGLGQVLRPVRHTPAVRSSSGTAGSEGGQGQGFEPFDPTGIPEPLRKRTEDIAEQASMLALTVFDREFVTLVRLFAAGCARTPRCPFGRGRFDLWASGVVYAVAQLNGIPGGWGPLSMDAEDLTDQLPGAHSTIVAKARDLRRLLGLERYDVDHEFLHSRSDALFFDSPGSFTPTMPYLGPDPGLDESGFDGEFRRPAAVRPTGVSAGGSTGSRPGAEACFVLYVSLAGSKPTIWRRLRVPVNATFADLHRVLQLAFDWLDYHLHDFSIDGYRLGARMEEEYELDYDADEATTTLGELLKPGDQVLYTYDYGDNWEHGIVVEQLELDGASREHGPWAVLDGAMAGPPEDCGGVWGYRELLEAREDPNHPEHEEIMDWLPPGYDPKRFDPGPANQAVRNHRW